MTGRAWTQDTLQVPELLTPDPGRITAALDLAPGGPLEGPEVDIACGTVEPHVDRWETGQETPTQRQVELLAELTGFPPAWFYGEPLSPIESLHMCRMPEWAGGTSRTGQDRARTPSGRPWSPIPHRRPDPAPTPSRQGPCPRCHRPAPALDVRCACEFRVMPR